MTSADQDRQLPSDARRHGGGQGANLQLRTIPAGRQGQLPALRVERRTRLRAAYTAGGVTERFSDHVPKGTRLANPAGGPS